MLDQELANYSVHVSLSAQSCPTLCNLWTVAYQTPLSKEFSREEYWSGLPFPTPGDLPDQGSNPYLLCLQQVVSLPLSHLGNPANYSQRAKSGPLPVFVNKVLLKHSGTLVCTLSMAAFTLDGQS